MTLLIKKIYMNDIRITSFNCNSVRGSIEVVRNLTKNFDIVLLQEIMLLSADLPILNDINENFNVIAQVKDKTCDGIIDGRPSKGVAILYRNFLEPFISPFKCSERIIGLKFNFKRKLFLFNVYMPFEKKDHNSYHDFLDSLFYIQNLLNETSGGDVLLCGDFNADPSGGRFWRELVGFCERNRLHVADATLPPDSFSYLSPAHDTTRWLDHVICTSSLSNKIHNIEILYTMNIYDHFPVTFVLEMHIDNPVVFIKPVNEYKTDLYINWNKVKEKDIKEYQCRVNNLLRNFLMKEEVSSCNIYNCKIKSHRREIDSAYGEFSAVLLSSSELLTNKPKGSSKPNFKIVPGWNEYVKGKHLIARDKLKTWVQRGKPLDGNIYAEMKSSRSDFRKALQQCKNNENSIRNDKMTGYLEQKNNGQFWSYVKSIKNYKDNINTKIDGETDPEVLPEIFSNNFKSVFDDKECQSNVDEELEVNLNSNVRSGIIFGRISETDVLGAIRGLKPYSGPDGIHSNHFKFASAMVSKHFAKFLSCCIVHGYLPSGLLYGVINPILKDKMGDHTSSGNYRPIISSTVSLKILELCIMKFVAPHIYLSDHQHGFRKNHSTVTACLCLKETVNKYINNGSHVYGAFLDFSKAFDKIDHVILMKKLVSAGVPNYIVNLIYFWYNNQYIACKYNNHTSSIWKLNNGVRQGAILSPLFFCLYINDLIEKIVSLDVGCRYGISSSNLVAYADDIVLLAPSIVGLQVMLDLISAETVALKLKFNSTKSVILPFGKRMNLGDIKARFYLNGDLLSMVHEIKYLGFIINMELNEYSDIIRCRNKFYNEFNGLLRKFGFLSPHLFLKLFKTFCMNFYGVDTWINMNGSAVALRQFSVGYHKALKKILKMSTHESNHYVCQEAGLFTFENLVNRTRIMAVMRLLMHPSSFIWKNFNTFYLKSFFIYDIENILKRKYEVYSILDNDIDAITSRIIYVQNHEMQMRTLPLHT